MSEPDPAPVFVPSSGVFTGFAQFRTLPQGEIVDQTYMGWDALERLRFILP